MEREEVEDVVRELSEEGKSVSEIGIILRDQYAVPDASDVLGQKLTEFLEGEEMAEEVPEDLGNLVGRANNMRKHLEDNPKDSSAKRGLARIEARIRKLARYYRDSGDLPADWSYVPLGAGPETGR